MFRGAYHAYLFLALATLALPSAAAAFEMSSKRDCAICHVMWLDAFRSEEETLIKWQPGNVLMKDTQGIVSSEDICYSCHDGYVNDSRDRVWKYERHKTFVKPSKNVTIPASLPLSNKAEIYCGTCHSPHSTAAASKGGFTAIGTFLRENNADSRLCEMCHPEQAFFERNNGHFLGIPPGDDSYALPAPDGINAGFGRKIICETCHRVHGARGERIVVIDNRNSELCTACHSRQQLLLNTKHDLRLTMPAAKNIKQQLPMMSGPCGACHIPHGAANQILWARQFDPGGRPSQLCLNCHSEKSTAEIRQVGQHSHPVNVKSPADMALPDKLPLFSENAVRDADGELQCFSCHAVHRWDPNFALNTGSIEVDGDASNSFLRISNAGSSALCLACHDDKRQVTTSDHYLEITAPQEKNIKGLTPKESGPCGTCHVVHNAAGIHLWAKKLSDAKKVTTQLCTGCHTRNGAAEAKRIGPNDHPVDVTLAGLNGAVTADQLTDRLPLYDGNGTKTQGSTMGCLTCHEPHTWDPKRPQPDAQYPRKNMEGDNADSFLRVVNAPSSILCRFCHVDKAGVDGTAHDLNVSAPQAKNLLGQTVTSSGQCGVCHLTHNSPNEVALWSRAMGPVGTNGSVVDALCTSCHSKKGLANKAVPRIASHPREKLIINTILLSKKMNDTTPVFDNQGRKVAVGHISCPSCHDAHQWGFLTGGKNDYKNSQEMGHSKFLRAVSYKTVCVNCHGAEAPMRYLFFHEPEQRTAVVP